MLVRRSTVVECRDDGGECVRKKIRALKIHDEHESSINVIPLYKAMSKQINRVLITFFRNEKSHFYSRAIKWVTLKLA